MVLSNDEITELQGEIMEKIKQLREEGDELSIHNRTLQNLKFGSREVKRPAVKEKQKDPKNPKKTIEVVVKEAFVEAVYDVPPKSLDEPDEDLSESVRKKKFDKIKALVQ